MKRISVQARPGWEEIVASQGLAYHSAGGSYWNESAAYVFTEKETVELGRVSDLLFQAIVDTAENMLQNERALLGQFFSPRYLDIMEQSFYGLLGKKGNYEQESERGNSLYGRYDFGIDEHGFFRLFEYNAETPVCLVEGSYIQAMWMEAKYEDGTFVWQDDSVARRAIRWIKKEPQLHYQWNGVYDKLKELFAQFSGNSILFTCGKGEFLEYESTALYLADVASECGVIPTFHYIEDVYICETSGVISAGGKTFDFIFKLYPSEWMVAELKDQGWDSPEDLLCANNFLERPHKLLLGGKMILPELWQRYNGTELEEYLIPAFHTRMECLDRKVVAKSWFGRIGTEVEILEPYQETSLKGPVIYQLYTETQKFDGKKVSIGVFHVMNESCGYLVREQDADITTDACQCVPVVTEFKHGELNE